MMLYIIRKGEVANESKGLGVRKSRLLTLIACFFMGIFPPACRGQSNDWRIYDEAAKKAFNAGNLDDAEQNWRDALREAEKSSNVEPGMVNCLCSLALVNEKKGNGQEAERLYELAMRNMEGLVGPTSPRFADWMPDLAFIYDAHGRPDRAEVLFKKALTIKEKSYGAEDLRVADVLDDYARFLRKNNRGVEATSLELRSKQIREKRRMQE